MELFKKFAGISVQWEAIPLLAKTLAICNQSTPPSPSQELNLVSLQLNSASTKFQVSFPL